MGGDAPVSLRLGLIGDPVAHSISPAMQGAGLAALGIAASYELWPTPAAELAARIAGLRAADVLGANVTVPHKGAVIDLLDEISPLAWRAGAVNTIVHRNGVLSGDNTDVHGFATSLGEICPNPGSRAALILGAGGAARAVALALEAMGVGRITIANRTPERAKRLAEDLRPSSLRATGADAATMAIELRRASILVNATSAGWRPGETPVPPDLMRLVPPDAIVVDLTYRDTEFLRNSRFLGLRTQDGLPMLVHQGARALELWTGRPAPLAAMLAAAERAREERR